MVAWAVGTAKTRAALRRVLSIILFGIAFGYVEAAVVVYLRTIGGPARVAARLGAQDLFPLLRLDALSPAVLALLKIEVGREAATLLMLAGVGLALTGNIRTWLAGFALAFGVWDLAFYFWLRVLIGWPASLGTWDLLFLLPVPWAAPVLAPVIVASTIAFFGARILLKDQRCFAPRRSPLPVVLPLSAGCVILLASFTWQWRSWMAGAMPQHFPWLVFAMGEALLIAGFLPVSGALPEGFGHAYRTKNTFLSTPGSTATSKKPTIISSEL